MALSSKQVRVLGVMALVVLCGVVYLALHAGEESTDDAQLDAHVVTLSSKLGGHILAIHVQDNQHVKAGDLIMEVAPTDYTLRVDRAQAVLDAAKAGLTAINETLETTQVSAPSNLDAVKAQVDAAQANWNKASNDLGRMRRLSDEARSQQQLDDAIATERTMRSSLEDAKARLRAAQTAPKTIQNARSNKEVQEAQVRQAEAELAQAKKDLADTRITAPMDGVFTKRTAEQGDFIQTGQQLGTLVGDEMWVIANFKETQLTHMRAGQKAHITIDAYPSVALEGKVESIQRGTGARFSAFPPENATGNFVKVVQRVPVKILLTTPLPAGLSVGPGMSVTPTVIVK